MVTGTNGKTTTAAMISHILNEVGLKHIVNGSGANLIGGITSALINSVDIKDRSTIKLALLEVDEATVSKVAGSMQPDVLVVTNFFCDQLDRFGELYAVVDKVRSGIGRFPKVKLVLNADDSLCASLRVDSDDDMVFFGVEPGAAAQAEEHNISTASYCCFCRDKYEYSYRVLGHLGGYKCPNCGFKRPQTQVKCTQVIEQNAESSTTVFEVNGREYIVKIGMPGLFNVYNALAAAACCQALDISPEKAVGAFERFESCFGRMEAIHAHDGKTSEAVLEAMNRLRADYGDAFSRIFKTITADNGSEFEDFSKVEEWGTQVYFTHPDSSWERPQNERHNGLIRRYIPKGVSIEKYDPEEVLAFADEMNSLPHKRLDYSTPEELFDAFLDAVYVA
jgi:UDP-N-acetylmuramyl tripeptide synthase